MVDLDLFLQRERLITQPLAWLDLFVGFEVANEFSDLLSPLLEDVAPRTIDKSVLGVVGRWLSCAHWHSF